MRTTRIIVHPSHYSIVALLALAAVGATTARADKWKANNTVPLNQAASWTNNAVPTSTEFGVWDSTVTGPMTNSLGANLTWGGIKILDPGGPVTLTAGNMLTLMGVGGIAIDLSSATQDLTLHCPVTVASDQAWNIGSDRLLTVDSLLVNAPIQFGGLGGLRINSLQGAGIYAVDYVIDGLTSVGPMIGDLTVTVSGTGTVVFDGANTYTGPTTVSNGTLLVSGSLAADSVVTVKANATLGGNGVIGGPTTVEAGATLAPGVGGIGTLTVTNTLSLAGTTRMEINRTNASNCDKVTGITTLTYGGTLSVTNLGPALQAGDTFILFSASSFFDVWFEVNLPPLDPGLGWDTHKLGVDGSLSVVQSLVITTQPADQTVGECSNATFTVAATGCQPMSYTWYRNGSPIPNAHSPSYTTDPVRFWDSGTQYYVVVSNACDVVTSATATLTVNPDVLPPSLLSARAVCASNQVRVTFSEPVEPSSAANSANYVLDQGVMVTSAILLSSNLVSLDTTALTPEVTYTLTVISVTDLCANNVIAPNSQIAFVCSTNLSLAVTKANNTVPLNQAASWTKNAVPTSTEFGVWDATVTGPMTNSLGANLTWGGIKILDPGGPVTLTAGNTLTLNGVSDAGIDMSGATQDLDVYCGLGLASNQTWSVAYGRTLTAVGIISGEGGLTKAGAGALLLSGNSTYAGPTVLSSGVLQLQSTPGNTVGGTCYALGTNTLILAAGAALQLRGNSVVSFRGGQPTVVNGGTVRLEAAPVTAGVSNQTLAFGSGGLSLANATLAVTNMGGYGVSLGACTCDLSAGSVVFNSLETRLAIGPVTLVGGQSKGIYPVDFVGSSYGNPSEIEWNFGDGGKCASIVGSGSVRKSGNQFWAFLGDNSYSGETTVNGGALALLGNNAGVGGPTTVSGGARLVLVASGSNTVGGTCYALGTNTLTLAAGAALQLRGNSAASFLGGQPTVVNGGTVRLEVAPVTAGVSNQTLAFASGGLSLANATLAVTNVGGYGVSLGACTCDLSAGSVLFNSLETRLAIGRMTLAGGTSKGIYPTDFVGSSYGSPSEIEWNFGDGSKNIICGPVGGSGSVRKSGNNALLLSGANTYSGNTEVAGGALVVDGTISGSGQVTVKTNATLGGNGGIGEPVSVEAGGTFSPGNGIGTLAVSNTLTLAGTALMQVNRTNTSSCDQVAGVSTLTYGGILAVTNFGPTLQAGDAFTLFIATHYTGSFASIVPATPGPGLVWDTARLLMDGTLSVRDTTPPILSCPSNLVVYADANQCAATVVFPVSAVDDSDPAPVLVCVPPSGGVLPVGQTSVVCTATDASGNSNTCAFSVSVVPAAMAGLGTTLDLRLTGPIRCVASSADGRKLVAGGWGGPSYTSEDYGATWIARRTNDSVNCIASSANGTKLAMARWTEPILTSADSGTTWTPREAYTQWPVWNTWSAIACSTDGARLVAAESDGYLYTTSDSGLNWTRRDSIRNWFSIASSSDGTTLLAAEQNGLLYTSTNVGVTWAPRESSRYWEAVAMSADATRMVAVANNDQIYTSWDRGETWTARDTNRQWTCVSSSADGLTLVAGAYQDYLYYSADGGVTWSPRGPIGQYWISVALSADGTRVVAADAYAVEVYTSLATVTPLTNPPTILGATNQWVLATGPGGAVVTYSVTATSVCQPNVPVICTPPSGSLFPLGTNTVQCVAVDALGTTNTATFTVVVAAPSVMFCGLVHSPLGNATLGLQANQLTAANLGSSGQDGVTIELGNPPGPYGFEWVAYLTYLGDLSQHAGGTLSFSIQGVRSNGVPSVSTLTYTNPGGGGIIANYDFSGAFTNGPISVRYWWNGTVIASDLVTNSQVTLVQYDWPTAVGLGHVGPDPGQGQAKARETGPYGESASNMEDAGVIGRPSKVWRKGGWLDVDEVEVVAPTDLAISNVVVQMRAGGGGINQVTITNETLSPASGHLDYAGLDHGSLGYATLDVQSNRLIVSNLGSSGQDGVTIELGNPGAPNGFEWLAEIGYLGDASQHIGGALSLTVEGMRSNGVPSVTRATYTNSAGAGIQANYDFSGAFTNGPISVTCRLNGTVVAGKSVTNNQVGLVFSDWPMSFRVTLSGPYQIKRAKARETGPYGQSISNVGDAGVIGHPFEVEWEGSWVEIDTVEISAPTDQGLSNVVARLQGGGGGITSIAITNESLVPHGAAVVMEPISGGFNLSWPADEGWILQDAAAVTGPWNDVSTTTNYYQVIPTKPNEYYRLKLGP